RPYCFWSLISAGTFARSPVRAGFRLGYQSLCSPNTTGTKRFYSPVDKENLRIARHAQCHADRRIIFGNITLPIRYDGLNDKESSYQTIYPELVMLIMIASIMNFMGPDMMIILLIVLLLFGAK